MSPALAALDLDFGYPERRVGSGVSFALAAGEVVALLGPNGSGKTTLFKTLLGLLPAQGGEVRVLGRPLGDYSRPELARAAAYVPQAYAGYFPFTVLDMVLMGRTAHLGPFASPGARDRALGLAVLERLGIAALAERPYTRISGGQRQLTLVARALAQEPALLIMDEPTASLDFGNQVRVLEQIGRLAGEGLAIVLSTHHPDHAFQCADRVLLLDQGRLIDQGPPQAVITAERMRAVYGVEVAVQPLSLAGGGELRVCLPLWARGGPRP